MKRILIIGSVIIAIVALIVFNRITSKNKVFNAYTEVKKGTFEITVINSGELIAEKSLDIKGPEIGQGSGRPRAGSKANANVLPVLQVKTGDRDGPLRINRLAGKNVDIVTEINNIRANNANRA